MPRIDYGEARSIGLATINDAEIHRTDPGELGPWDICLSCWHDNQLDDDCEHPDYDMENYLCLVCTRPLTGAKDNHPYTKEGDNSDMAYAKFSEGFNKGMKHMNESQPGAPLTEREEYCLKLANDIKAFEHTIQENGREIERLAISTKVSTAAIEATREVLNNHRNRL